MVNLNLEPKGRNQVLILHWLERNISAELAAKINGGNKTLAGCWNYIRSEAKKQATKDGCAAIEDDVVYGWAIHYFEEDAIKENGAETKQTSTKPAAKSADPTQKPQNTPLKAKSDVEQINLFDLIQSGEEGAKTE